MNQQWEPRYKKTRVLAIVAFMLGMITMMVWTAIEDSSGPTQRNGATKVDLLPRSMGTADFLANEKVVSVSSVFPSGETEKGSGAFISPGLVLTAAHVVSRDEEIGEVTVYWYGRPSPAQVISFKGNFDLALLEVDDCVFNKAIGIRSDMPSSNEPLTVTGFSYDHTATYATPYSVETSVIPGIKMEIPTWAHISVDPEITFAITARLVPGNSGSPVFDSDSQLVGIAVVRDGWFGRSHVVQGWVIERFVLDALGDKS